MRRFVPRPFSPPPFDNRIRPSREDTKPLLPAASSHGPRATSKLIAAPRATNCASQDRSGSGAFVVERANLVDVVTSGRTGTPHRSLGPFETRDVQGSAGCSCRRRPRHSRLETLETQDSRNSRHSSLMACASRGIRVTFDRPTRELALRPPDPPQCCCIHPLSPTPASPSNRERARGRSIARGAATTSDVVRGRWRRGRGEQVSWRRATVSSGDERAEGKKVEGWDTLATMNVDRWLAA